MLKILLSLVPTDKPAYLVLHAETKQVIGILHLEFNPDVRYIFQHQGGGKLTSGGMMVNVLEQALEQPIDVDFTVPQDLLPIV
jgi:hypothetical protein